MIAGAPNTSPSNQTSKYTMPQLFEIHRRTMPPCCTRHAHTKKSQESPRGVSTQYSSKATFHHFATSWWSWKTTYICTQQLAHVLIQSHTLTVYPANAQPHIVQQPFILRAWLPQPLLQQLDHHIWAGEKWQSCYRPIRKFFISVPNIMPQGPQQPLAQTLAEGNQMFHQVVNDSDTLELFPPIGVTTRRIISLPGDRS